MKMTTELPEESKTSINSKDDVISPVVESASKYYVREVEYELSGVFTLVVGYELCMTEGTTEHCENWIKQQ